MTDTAPLAEPRPHVAHPSIFRGTGNELLRVVPKRKKAQLLLDSILGAARIVAMGSSGPLTTTRVAEVAECSVAAVYRYFSDMHEIRAALVAEDWSLYVEAALDYALVQPIRTPVDLLNMHFHLRETTLREGIGPIPTIKRYTSPGRPSESELIARLHLFLLQPPGIGAETSPLLNRLELVVRVTDALVARAFAASPDGDPAMLAEAKTALLGYIDSPCG